MKKKIILIQDDEIILDLMNEVLVDQGFEVIASLTIEPIQEINDIQPAIIILDDNIMGDKKGSELIKELKNNPETEEVVAVLTSTSFDLSKKAEECKADDYIEKPFDIEQMINVVKNNY